LSAIPKLLFVYDHFFPAYKAGGPIQSLTNLATALKYSHEISVLTSAFDLNERQTMENMQVNEWAEITVLQHDIPINVWYAGLHQPTVLSFKEQLKKVDPTVVYLNGMFSFRFVIIPLVALKNSTVKVVLCPRGMLQAGALAGKSLKKRAYLSMLKISGLLKRVVWHATNEEEERDIQKLVGKGSRIVIAPNIPKKPLDSVSHAKKIAGSLRLVYLSLISEKKNLLQAIEIVGNSDSRVSLDIYGPIKDTDYWNKCKVVIEKYPGRINYKGDVHPETVQDTFSEYDACILLTKGENFGHALYECLSAGRPVITSYFTPWNDLRQRKAGWNLDISNNISSMETLGSIAALDAPAFESFCEGAHQLASSYYATSSDMGNYHKLFSIN